MPGIRDHEAFIIEEFGGLWDRGDPESVPADHFIEATNVQFFDSGVETRDPLDKYHTDVAINNIYRVYDYVTVGPGSTGGPTLLVLTIVFGGPGGTTGTIHHITSRAAGAIPFQVLSLVGMTDFGFVAINGRAYITPFHSLPDKQGINYEIGLPNQFLYVYDGKATTPARKAAGAPPYNGTSPSVANGLKPFVVYNDSVVGVVTEGLHVFTVTFSNGGYGPTVVQQILAPGDKKIKLTGIPLGPFPRQIAMSQAGATTGLFEAAVINDSTTTELTIDIDDTTLGTKPAITVNTSSPNNVNVGMLVINNVPGGHCDIGFHIVGVVFETDSGYLTAPGPQFFASNTYTNSSQGIGVHNIPVPIPPVNVNVVKRHLVSTKAIPEYNGDQKGYQFFFIPKGTLPNMTDVIMNVSYYDSDLVADASHLIDNYSEIPAGVALNTYHSRLVLVGEGSYPEKEDGTPDTTKPDNRSVARVSMPGEPEAISKVDGLIIVPLDGNPLTNVQEFRDILYLFKRSRTYAYSDNRDEPATWQEEVIDQGVGSPVHGIASVLDSGGVNIDYLLIADWSGFMLFNGVYARPELSWKIENFWANLDRNSFRYIQVSNDSLTKKIWITLPAGSQYTVLHADYGDGLDPKHIKWAKWTFDAQMYCTCLIEINKLILGAVDPSGTGIPPNAKWGTYYINPKKAGHYDTYYNGSVKIPNPTIRTALLGE